MMQIKHKFDFQVLSHEVDGAQHMRLTTLESCLLNVAGFAADENGFGSVGLMEEGVTWVLIRLAVEMDRLPERNEHFTVETWVEDYGRMLTTRNFRLLSEGGALLGRAVSQWAILDLKTRRPVDLQSHADFGRFANGEEVGIDKPRKLPAVGTIGAGENKHRVSYSDIDFNGHVNSMKYLEWALDTLPIKQVYERPVKRLDINYIKESMLGEEVVLLTEQKGDTYEVEIRDAEGGVHCRVALNF